MSLGDDIVRNDEVVGSIPTSSTNPFNHLPSFYAFSEHRKLSIIGPFWTVIENAKNHVPKPRPFGFRLRQMRKAVAQLAAETLGRFERRYPSWSKCASVAFDLAPISGPLQPVPSRLRAKSEGSASSQRSARACALRAVGVA